MNKPLSNQQKFWLGFLAAGVAVSVVALTCIGIKQAPKDEGEA